MTQTAKLTAFLTAHGAEIAGIDAATGRVAFWTELTHNGADAGRELTEVASFAEARTAMGY